MLLTQPFLNGVTGSFVFNCWFITINQQKANDSVESWFKNHLVHRCPFSASNNTNTKPTSPMRTCGRSIHITIDGSVSLQCAKPGCIRHRRLILLSCDDYVYWRWFGLRRVILTFVPIILLRKSIYHIGPPHNSNPCAIGIIRIDNFSKPVLPPFVCFSTTITLPM